MGKDVYLKAMPTFPHGPYAKLYKHGNTWTDMAINASTGIGAGCITQNIYDGFRDYIYIKLGTAYSASNIFLSDKHPIYYGISPHERVLYECGNNRMLKGIGTGAPDFKNWIISICKSLPSGTITPIGFILDRTEMTNTNLVTTDRGISIYCSGFLHNELFYNNNVLEKISGELYFWETNIPDNSNIIPQTYLWHFNCNNSDTTGGTWTYNFARSLPSTYEHAA